MHPTTEAHTPHCNSQLMTAKEVADLLNVKVSWVRENTRIGRVPCITLGRYRRYRRETILDWVSELEKGGRRL